MDFAWVTYEQALPFLVLARSMHLGPITQEKTDRPQMWQKAMPDFLGNWFPARHIACELALDHT